LQLSNCNLAFFVVQKKWNTSNKEYLMVRMKSIAELEKELEAKQKQLHKLLAKRDQLGVQLQKVEVQITALQGNAAQGHKVKIVAKKAGRKGRKRAAGSLADILAKAMEGKGNVKVSQAAKMALDAGYTSKSKQFGNVVSQTLANDDRFTKISRGLFRVN
jgi:hypothetical protein